MTKAPTEPSICGNYWRTFWYDIHGTRHSHSLGSVVSTSEADARRAWRAWSNTDHLLAAPGGAPASPSADGATDATAVPAAEAWPSAPAAAAATAATADFTGFVEEELELANLAVLPTALDLFQLYIWPALIPGCFQVRLKLR